MNKFIQIDGRKIGQKYAPYIIAEMSANHNGHLDNALKLIEIAKKSGSDAIKLQTYRPDTITIDCDNDDFQIKGGLWGGQTLYQLYETAHMPWEWHKPLFEYARKIGITIFSTPFDKTAVDFLEDLNVPAYKIASFELVDLPLIRYVAKTGKPIIMSTGMANAEEIQEAVEAAYNAGCKELALLHCVSGYPAKASEYNLKTISDMVSRFGCVIGLSDHTLDNTTAIASIAIGNSIVENHFTLNRQNGGPDDSFSLEPLELAQLCDACTTAWSALGSIDYTNKVSETESLKHRRSLYFVANIKAGEIVTPENIKSIRPGYGLPPKFYEEIIGKKLKCNVLFGTPVSFSLLE